ncbi:uncharacterized protein LOC128985778 [Macrosteles quadrilineatus]|uniref:uncharacterized protein LOC128985778 n=1 Tax=Macrosteles quadrilineatus TaxID=74068 RepID=UPI0023E21FEB|nr:uncharacterized protein LOC128985778 [Macrosteles quadrilineatus]
MLVLRCLGQSHTQEYYSLALLDSKLQVLLAALRSRQSADSAANLWQLLTAFHCESPHSFMGISITRNTVLCLNKMLSLTQDWEGECEPNIRWLLHEGGLCSSGDVVVRAAALNLLSGLALTPRGAVTLLDTCPDIIHFTMRTVVDHCEASVVREYAAKLLTNINKHSICKEMMVSARDVNLFQEFRESVNLVALAAVQSHLEQSTGMLHTDPRFVKAGCWLLTNLLVSAVDEMLPSVSSSGLTTALCRTLQSIDRLMSPEIVSLAAAVCRLLVVCCEAGCDIAQLPDCAAAIMSFLDPDSFDFDPAESSEEVQSLWQETLRLLSYVLGFMGAEVILNSASVTVLSQCIAIVDPQCTSLRLTALQAVPALATSLTPNSEAVLCESLVAQWDRVKGKARPALLAALTALLGHSSFATTTALSLGLVASVITRLRELHLTLTIQTSSTDKLAKKDPRMVEMLHLVQLLSAALYHSGVARREAATHGAADTLHKLWAWCHADDKYLIATLNCLITFTADCPLAAGSLVLTSTTPGTGQRRSPTAHSLAHAVITMVTKERHSDAVTGCALTLLRHCCQSQDTRNVISKSGLLSKWSDLLSDRRQNIEEVQELWFKFILTFTFYPEGQLSLPKTGELFTQLVMNVESSQARSRGRAVAILRNLATHNSNKPRLLSNKRLLQALGEVLLSGEEREQQDVALIVWSLAANSQKAKVALRSVGLVQRLTLASATANDKHVFSLVIDLLQQG